MANVRLLVGTRKGAFILTSDAKRKKWKVSEPIAPGWEIYHFNGSPADPDRLYLSQSTGWFGQVIQRSDDGGKTWQSVGNNFAYEGDPGPTCGTTTHPTPGSSTACGVWNPPSLIPTPCTPV